MASHRTKQKPTGNVTVTIDSDVMPAKKRKATANSITERLKQQTKAELWQTETDKREENVVADESASPTKKSHLRAKNAITKDKKISKSRKVKQEDIATTMENNNSGEEIAEMVEENTRGKLVVTKKAGMKKPAAEKLKVRELGAKNLKTKVAITDGGDFEEKQSGRSALTKKSRHANGPTEENKQLVTERPAKRMLRKRKITEAVIKAEDTEATKEKLMPNKTTRNKTKKAEINTGVAPKVKSKERSKENSTKSNIKSSKKSETEEHNVENITRK